MMIPKMMFVGQPEILYFVVQALESKKDCSSKLYLGNICCKPEKKICFHTEVDTYRCAKRKGFDNPSCGKKFEGSQGEKIFQVKPDACGWGFVAYWSLDVKGASTQN